MIYIDKLKILLFSLNTELKALYFKDMRIADDDTTFIPVKGETITALKLSDDDEYFAVGSDGGIIKIFSTSILEEGT